MLEEMIETTVQLDLALVLRIRALSKVHEQRHPKSETHF